MSRHAHPWIASVAPAAALAAGGLLLIDPPRARAEHEWSFEPAELGVPPPARRVELTLGLDARRLGRHDLEFDAPRSRGPTPASASDAPGERDGEALAVSLRSSGELTHRLYLGLHGSLGKARLRDLEGLYFEAGGTVALLVLDGPLDVRGELLAGVRGVSAEHPDDWATEHEPIVEPRVSAALRLGPGHSIGARLGSDVTREGDLLFGVFLSFRDRAPHAPSL